MIPGESWWSGNGHECFELSKTIVAQLQEQSHEIVRLPNRTICEKSCGCKASLQFYLRFVGVVFAYLRS